MQETHALPILDLPLDEIEEALGDPGPSRRSLTDATGSNQASSARSRSMPDERDAALENERRALNSSNDTTIIRDGAEATHDTRQSFLRNQASFLQQHWLARR